mmetsp:Transcript_19159/g.48603  ORF Transcript_19159/g.48603 Transcript_19159/m.48603 type:complete len:222 (-) Transcript_19159:590-1255(-)
MAESCARATRTRLPSAPRPGPWSSLSGTPARYPPPPPGTPPWPWPRPSWPASARGRSPRWRHHSPSRPWRHPAGPAAWRSWAGAEARGTGSTRCRRRCGRLTAIESEGILQLRETLPSCTRSCSGAAPSPTPPARPGCVSCGGWSPRRVLCTRRCGPTGGGRLGGCGPGCFGSPGLCLRGAGPGSGAGVAPPRWLPARTPPPPPRSPTPARWRTPAGWESR